MQYTIHKSRNSRYLISLIDTVEVRSVFAFSVARWVNPIAV